MHGAIDVIRRLHEHRVWSAHRLLDACRSLDADSLGRTFEIGRGSLWSTLVHLHAADRLWLDVLQGREPPRFPDDQAFESFQQLEHAWRDLDAQWWSYLNQLEESHLEHWHERHAKWTTAADILMHVCLHARYTTAQAMNMLRHLGVDPLPVTMHITMAREQSVELDA